MCKIIFEKIKEHLQKASFEELMGFLFLCVGFIIFSMIAVGIGYWLLVGMLYY